MRCEERAGDMGALMLGLEALTTVVHFNLS